MTERDVTNVQVAEAADELTDHDYDGIQEYDNPLPGWWKWLFVISIFYSGFYWLYYHIGVGPDLQQTYEAEKVSFVRNLVQQMGEVQPDNPTIMNFARNAEWMDAISGVFVGNCAQCHANDGGGNIGPNMTDDSYKNIKQPSDFFKVISEGVPGTAMVGRSNQFSPEEIILLSAYVAHLRGTTPAAPKAAEGERIGPWPTYQSQDAGESGAETGEKSGT